jgi:hypothetical protein
MKAHQPDISTTMLVEKDQNQWLLQISGALTGFQYAIKDHYGDAAYATPEEFQDLVLNHLQENLSIIFNDHDKVSFANGFVKLGHETNVVFEIKTVPNTIESIQVKNSSFKNIYHNQSALIILKKGIEQQQFILNNDNEHQVEVIINGNKFQLVKQSKAYLIYLLGALGLLIFGLFLYFSYKKIKQPS